MFTVIKNTLNINEQHCQRTESNINVLPLTMVNRPSLSRLSFSAKTEDKVELKKGFSPALGNLIKNMKTKYGYLKDKNVVMLFSGGFDTSFLAKVFTDEIGAKVATLSLDLGDQRLSSEKINKKAKKAGVHKHIDSKALKPFINEYVLPSIYANARYNGKHPLSSSLSRPLMMKTAINFAKETGSPVIIQGTNPLQNNAPRFQKAFDYLAAGSDLKMLQPVLELNIDREIEKEYLQKKGINITQRENDVFSADGNIWNWEAEDGKIRTNPFYRPDLQIDGIFNTPENAPDIPETLTITFLKGIPVEIDGQKMSLQGVIEKLNEVGGKHGIGIHDALESRPLGFKEREIHVSPVADILIEAHEDLEQAVLPDDLLEFKQNLDRKWTKSVCNGDWFRETVKSYNTVIKQLQDKVTGKVKLKLYKGHIDILGRTSENSLDVETLKIEDKRSPSLIGFKETAFLSRQRR